MRLRTILISAGVLVVSFAGATLAMRLVSPQAEDPPALAETAPLPPITRSSVVIAPTAIALTAIRDALEAHAPRTFAGKRDNPLSQVLSQGEIGWTVTRGPLAVTGRPETLTVSAPLNGTLNATGRLSSQAAGGIGGLVGGLLGGEAGREAQRLAGRNFDQRADIRGSVTMTARPAITPAWRIEPNLAAQVTIGDGGLNIAGVRLNVANEVKPLLDHAVGEEVGKVEARLRDDPFIEQAARREWSKICRSFALGALGAGLPSLWLELRPTRAFAAQPRIDQAAVTLTVGVEAETRIVPNETAPECPFPATLDLVPPSEQERVKIAMPIDVPFAEVNRLIEARLAGKTFQPDVDGVFGLVVKHASVAASGDRVLISLRVKATEQQSWLNFGRNATVYLWGKPTLDRDRQVLRLTNVVLDVDSGGFFGFATRAVMPLIEAAVAEATVIDLKPFATSARNSIEAALADFHTGTDGVRVAASVTDLRLVALAFDAKTLRVVAEADGTAHAAVSALPAIGNQ